jgi:hypothetical protein
VSSNRFLTLVNGTLSLLQAIASSAGAADGNKIVMTDSNGRLNSTLMPVGLGADTQVMTALEAIPPGAYVNIASNGLRLADNSNGRAAHGFVLTAVANGAQATFYRLGRNTALAGLTPGARLFLGVAGGVTAIPPTTPGAIIQVLGVPADATSMPFEFDEPILVG